MTMLPQEIIRKKRDGKPLSTDEIRAFFEGYQKGEIADYQMGAMLMAIVLKGMAIPESAELTKIMRDSGEVLRWPYPREQVVDKHSTGGIGDKTSLILLPLCVLEGCRVPMMSGRGLGHTGGTLDKLESIPGFKVQLPIPDAKRIVDELGGVFIGQTEQVAALDRRLYAMRDVTATVESIPLITASILSKKLAEGIGVLVMDVKFGTGAFMQKKDDALALARSLADVGRGCGLDMSCLLTSMNSPLGTYAGNALEVLECVEIMQGRGPATTRDLTIELSVEMVAKAFPKRSRDEIRQSMLKNLSNGKAFDLFCRIARAQGGDTRVLENTKLLDTARVRREVIVQGSGPYVSHIDVRQLGVAVQTLGGGRRLMTDTIDHAVGITALRRVGDKLAPNEPVAVIHGNNESLVEQALAMVRNAYTLGADHVADPLMGERL